MEEFMKQIRFLLWLAAAMMLWAGCSSTQPGMRKFKGVNVPPGVDPIVAVRADSLAHQLFVSYKDELHSKEWLARGREHVTLADSLWRVLDLANQSKLAVSAADSAAAMQHTIAGAQELQQAMPLVQKYASTQDNQTKIQASHHLQEAEQALRRALELNPHANEARRLLAGVYKVMGDRFVDKTNYDRAIEIWGSLVRLEPGEFPNYFRLGEVYFNKGTLPAFATALENFERCKELLLASAEVSDSRIADPSLPVEAAIDSNALFATVFYGALSAIRVNDEQKANSGLNEAWRLASTPSNSSAVESYINWINWDDGQIITAMMRDSAAVKTRREDYAGAAAEYGKMLPIMRSTRARNEISLKLAQLEYANLGDRAAAVRRMEEVIRNTPQDSLTHAPLDSNNIVYFDTYGAMCYNLGVDQMEKDRKLAYTYYSQAAAINWRGRGKAYFSMATLASADPQQAIKDGEKAFALAHQLEADELINLHRLLINSYRRVRDFENARLHLEMLKVIQQGASDGTSG